MEMLMSLIYAYLYILLYEALAEESGNRSKWLFVVMIAVESQVTKTIPITKQLTPFLSCTLIVLYSICIKSKKPNLKNLKYAIVAHGIWLAVNYILTCVVAVLFGLLENQNKTYMSVIICVKRIVVIFVIVKWKKYIAKVKKEWMLSIGCIATSMLLFTEQLLRIGSSTANDNYLYTGVVCAYVALLFTILWLLDHRKMANIQEMYAADNQQMSQKLHRSKEVLPMIANYVSNMEAGQDERMREKLAQVCRDYGKELGGMDMSSEFFDTTGIDLVDLLLRTKIIECEEQDIELNVFVGTEIDADMKRLDVGDGEVMRMLGDLLRNAMHAVSGIQDKLILLLIARDENGCVLFRIYDSGIPFPPYVLKNLGERGYTTWGTGNGLADLMATLKRAHASIEISTEMEESDLFTKQIIICFDGKETVKTPLSEDDSQENSVVQEG